MEIPNDPLAVLELLRYRLLAGMRRVVLMGYGEAAFALDSREVLPHAVDAEADAVVLDARCLAPEAAPPVIREAFAATSPYGAVYCVIPGGASADAAWRESLSACGTLLYCGWSLADEGAFSFFPGPELPGGDALLIAAMLVRQDYDPVQHARQLLREGRVQHAYEVLGNIPDALLGGDAPRGAVAAEKVLCLLAWDKPMDDTGRLNRFANALYAFYEATTYVPKIQRAYPPMALFWQRIGRGDMARRQVASLLHAAPDPATQQLYEGLPQVDAPDIGVDDVPAWSGRPFRILYLMHPKSDYGADILFDGLCRLLGPDRVQDYPHKASLHGGEPVGVGGYPCLFDWPGEALTCDAIVAQAAAGAYDAILYSDNFHVLPKESLQMILAAAGDTPLFITDTWDQCGDYRAEMEAHLGRAAAGQFKREMLAGMAYSPHTWPLHFAYPEGLVPAEIDYAAKSGFFWAGKNEFGLRRLHLEYLEEHTDLDLNARYPLDVYAEKIRGALAGLCLFGNGFDTVRYWELPAHGTLLIAERPPIRMVAPFFDGKHALHFDHLADLEDRLAWIDAHPGAAREIAEAGRAHLIAHHTATARARELLGRIESVIGGHQAGN